MVVTRNITGHYKLIGELGWKLANRLWSNVKIKHVTSMMLAANVSRTLYLPSSDESNVLLRTRADKTCYCSLSYTPGNCHQPSLNFFLWSVQETRYCSIHRLLVSFVRIRHRRANHGKRFFDINYRSLFLPFVEDLEWYPSPVEHRLYEQALPHQG